MYLKHYFNIISNIKTFNQIVIPFTQESFVPRLIEICLYVWRRSIEILLIYLLFRHYLQLEYVVAL